MDEIAEIKATQEIEKVEFLSGRELDEELTDNASAIRSLLPYKALLEAFKVVSDIKQLSNLLAIVKTLVKQVEAQLPLLAIRKKKVALTLEKLLTLSAIDRLDLGRSLAYSWMYWFDLICLMVKILETPAIVKAMHFGFAEFVDEATEYWHSMSWAALRAALEAWSRKYLDCSMVQPLLEIDELILIEDAINWVLETDIIEVLHDFQVDYTFATGISFVQPLPYSFKRIRRIVNRVTKKIRSIVLSNPIRAELEFKAYGRDWFENSSLDTLSIPIFCFIDGFGLYRNMYRSLIAVYLIIASLLREERANRANILLLTLCSYGSDFGSAITNISSMLLLDKGITVSRGDLMYDVVFNGKYYHYFIQLRKHGEGLGKTAYTKHCTEFGLDEELTLLVTMTFALDLVRTRLADPAYFEFGGQAKQAQLLLIEAILTLEAAKLYAAELRIFPFPKGWGRLQSLIKHLKSWRMGEAGRSIIITTLLLRCWLKIEFESEDDEEVPAEFDDSHEVQSGTKARKAAEYRSFKSRLNVHQACHMVDLFRYEISYVRVDAVFVYELLKDNRRAFLLVADLIEYLTKDDILKLPRYALNGR
ncbi:hypothetical protein MBM_06321 [Drepanopeziza brunnea f. sp. 'multigermtubi' MB_m1]|uniref:Uncharacterized protein n=1 Tax=Marssonina brunnea f. sp. multigermtubi (strain MB_m1) TaxID=1072389 RepID=K1X4W4_MARBU|nr:uncharacterized protein MBM_06321 [Drepanopeziza brunnea f. sp. 'multigermtubi' MB_m1]EKD15693.1 hypothetical protein MBM_06321 [Drepanopeziza brunnea f. sp. 'multigermtubi' MB_m1]